MAEEPAPMRDSSATPAEPTAVFGSRRGKKAALFCQGGADNRELNLVFNPERRRRLETMVELFPAVITPENYETYAPQLHELEVIFATWGMFPLSTAQLDLLPNLRGLFYAAGSVNYFAPERFLERGITIVSAWAANAVPVAEFTLAQILLANKGYWRNMREYRGADDFHPAFRGRGNFGATVSLLGAGQIGRKLIELLHPYKLRVLVFDPYLSHEAATELGVEKVELAEAFARGDVISNHLANVPATVRILNGALFASMLKDATFINTGRGATVAHDELTAVLQERNDLTALLDVSDPEPLPVESPLRKLPNAHLTTHIAGSINDEVGRMAETAFEEFEAWQAGRPLRYGVTLEMLKTMA